MKRQSSPFNDELSIQLNRRSNSEKKITDEHKYGRGSWWTVHSELHRLTGLFLERTQKLNSTLHQKRSSNDKQIRHCPIGFIRFRKAILIIAIYIFNYVPSKPPKRPSLERRPCDIDEMGLETNSHTTSFSLSKCGKTGFYEKSPRILLEVSTLKKRAHFMHESLMETLSRRVMVTARVDKCRSWIFNEYGIFKNVWHFANNRGAF